MSVCVRRGSGGSLSDSSFTKVAMTLTILTIFLLVAQLPGTCGSQIITRDDRNATVDTARSTPPASRANNSTGREDNGTEDAVLLDDAATQPNAHLVTHSDNHEKTPMNQNLGASSEERILVRKCCQVNEVLSLVSWRCEAIEGDTGFRKVVRMLLSEEAIDKDLEEYSSGFLHACPITGDQPTIHVVNVDSHSIQPLDPLRDELSAFNYNHEHYCLELSTYGADADNLSSPFIIVALCYPWPTDITTRKCCELDQYFDHVANKCLPKLANMSDEKSLVYEFYKLGPRETTFHIDNGRPTCYAGEYIKAEYSGLYNAPLLCEYDNGRCYSPSHYCIEYMWAQGDLHMTAVAWVCQLETFHRCCPNNEVFIDTICGAACGQHFPSLNMKQLLEIMEPLFKIPIQNIRDQCEKITTVKASDAEKRCWVTSSGHFSINTRSTDNYLTENRCIESNSYTSNQIEETSSDPLPQALTDVQSIGKCCPPNFYFMGTNCVFDYYLLDLINEPIIRAANVTKLTYTHHPKCHTFNNKENNASLFQLFSYNLTFESEFDYGFLTDDLNVEIVSMIDKKCRLSSRKYTRHEYCVEYLESEDLVPRPVVYVCQKSWVNSEHHTEKHILNAVLLGISCLALLVTAFWITSARIYRSSYDRKVIYPPL